MEQYGILMIGYAGSFGAGLIAEKKEIKLLERFPSFLIRNAVSEGKKGVLYKEMLLERLKDLSFRYDILCMEEAGDGGVFKGLWNLGEAAGSGFFVDLKAIPIKQETVEICNFFDINPYQLYSEGVILLMSKESDALAEELRRDGIPAERIGRTHFEKKRVILNEDEERFLEPRAGDAIVGME